MERLVIALGAAALLAVVVVVAAVAGGEEEAPAPDAPPECLRAWNSDRQATAFGRHNLLGHGYRAAAVYRLDVAGGELLEDEDGLCAVVFPRGVLDPEPVAAGEVLQQDVWTPLSTLVGVELTRVAELQAEAAGKANATIAEDGTLSAGYTGPITSAG